MNITENWYEIIRDTERYADSEAQRQRWPHRILIFGTRQQAQGVADSLSFDEAGCEHYWKIKEDVAVVVPNSDKRIDQR